MKTLKGRLPHTSHKIQSSLEHKEAVCINEIITTQGHMMFLLF